MPDKTNMKKATVKVYKEEKVEEIKCLFNPEQYSLSRTANYSEHKSSKKASKTQFTNLSPYQLSLSLFFDTYYSEKGESVTVYTSKIAESINMVGTLHKPPELEFLWGNFKFRGHVKSMNETFTMFDLDGRPTRAKIDLTIEEANQTNNGPRAYPFESPDRTKCKTIVQGMSLWKIAHEEYGDCSKWRIIAKENGIMNPLDIKPGQLIKIPAL